MFIVCEKARFVHLFLKLGTGLSIMISKRNPSLVRTFALLSCGYLFSSYQEVRSLYTLFLSWKKTKDSFVNLHQYQPQLDTSYLACKHQPPRCRCISVFLGVSHIICTLCSWQVRSVVLHTLNRARFSVAVESFIKTGAARSCFFIVSTLTVARTLQFSSRILAVNFFSTWLREELMQLIIYVLSSCRASPIFARREFKRRNI